MGRGVCWPSRIEGKRALGPRLGKSGQKKGESGVKIIQREREKDKLIDEL